jgi:hypothetical protein
MILSTGAKVGSIGLMYMQCLFGYVYSILNRSKKFIKKEINKKKQLIKKLRHKLEEEGRILYA